MKLEDIKNIPSGWTLWGSIPGTENQNLSEIADNINKNLDNIHSLAYLNQFGNYSYLTIKDFQITSSIGGKIVLVFLIDNIDLPLDLTPGTIIYRDLEQSSKQTTSESLVKK